MRLNARAALTSLAALLALAAAQAAPVARAQTPPAPSRAVGSITGRVIDDSGQPVPNVVVWAFARARLGQPRATAVTDDAGAFSIDGLEPTLYVLVVQTRGYVMPRDPSAQGLVSRRVGDNVTLRLVRGGVITGTVTDQDGSPLIAVPVRAYLIRDLDASAAAAQPAFFSGNEAQTDDRGVYRFYGLQPGVYVVAAGGAARFRLFSISPYDQKAPTFYPSATRDTAAEVSVREGQEATGVDIRYRGDRGRAVSGTVEGAEVAAAAADQGGFNTMIVHAPTGTILGQSFVSAREGGRGFIFEGVPDGEYELMARRFGRGEAEPFASAPLRVSVRGADVTGLRLTLAPLASVAGTLVLEPLSKDDRATSACADARPLLPEENIITARRDDSGGRIESGGAAAQARSRLATSAVEATPDASGSFNLNALDPGRYRLAARTASEEWYVRSVTLTRPPAAPRRAAARRTTPAPQTPPDAKPTAPAAKPTAPAAKPSAAAAERPSAPSAEQAARPAAQEFLQLASGQRAGGVTIRLAEGAASLRGRVVAGETTPLPPRVRVHLVPAAAERADDPLYFYEAAVAADGSFALTNVAPGRYLLLARTSPQPEGDFGQPRPAAWDAPERAALRRAAEAADVSAELDACQRATNYTLPFPARNTKQ